MSALGSNVCWWARPFTNSAPEDQRLVIARCAAEIKERRAISTANIDPGTSTSNPSQDTHRVASALYITHTQNGRVLRTAPCGGHYTKGIGDRRRQTAAEAS